MEDGLRGAPWKWEKYSGSCCSGPDWGRAERGAEETQGRVWISALDLTCLWVGCWKEGWGGAGMEATQPGLNVVP